MFKGVLSVTLLSALLAATPAHSANVYKWKDDTGITHYTEQAPTDRPYETVTTSGAPPSDAATAQARLDSQNATNAETAKKAVSYGEQQRIRDEEAKIKSENCKNAQANLKTIEENARIRMLGDDGEFRYLSEQERQEQMNQARKVIKNNCK